MSVEKSIVDSIPQKPLSIEDLPPLIFGGAVINTQYVSNPLKVPVRDMLDISFKNGIIAIDTSPYYGPSEEILGSALKDMKDRWERESYFICTKVGRVRLDEFDYSRKSVRKSVLRSLERLNTNYLDLVYTHDIEFVKEEEIFDALRELKLLKDEGLIRNIGVSGYPVKFLYHIALQCKNQHAKDIGPLDAVLSYSHGCLQNTQLFDMYNDFFENCGIKKLMNGSILSMSLLRSEKTLSFHPASQNLKDKVDEISNYLKQNYGIMELAELATRFAYKKWLFESKQSDPNDLKWRKNGSIIIGASNVEELIVAISNYWCVKLNKDAINERDDPIFSKVKELLGSKHYNETWKSGIDH